jgi:molybdate transport system substrate-binding protein
MMKTDRVIALALCLVAAGCSKKKADDGDKESGKSTEPTAGGEKQTPEEKPADATPLRIAGAANLAKVMGEIVPLFEKDSGAKVDFIPGSSGKLAAQLKEGAPFDLFMAANVKFVDDATSGGECLADSKKIYARGHLVMWSPEGAKVEAPAKADGLADKKFETIAVAQPDQAPYGAAAKAALDKLGVWKKIEKRVIYGPSLEETIKLVESGNAEIGLLALSQVIKGKGKYTQIPDELHDPLDQALAVCKNGKQQALAGKFVEFLARPEIKDLMKSYGYTIP